MDFATATGPLLLAVLHLKKFESFKGAGFEAKLRHTVSEAYATIDKLRDVAVSLADPFFYRNRDAWQHASVHPASRKDRTDRRIEDAPRRVGVEDDAVKRATSRFYEEVGGDPK